MALPICQIDAFTDRPFSGNPAAVCLLDGPRSARWMQALAAEMNLAETAFLLRRDDGFDLRWFTPRVEVDLCGHATLAAAHALWEAESVSGGPISFHTRSGVLVATRSCDWIELDFPEEAAAECLPAGGLIEALDVVPHWVGRNRMDWIVQLADEAAVRAAAPEFAALRVIDTRGVIVTAASDDPAFHFVSRFFAPSVGIDEDPVTGSAHCCLAPFWSERLGMREMTGRQLSERGGVVRVRLGEGRVFLGGQAVTVFRGELSGAVDA